MIARTLERIQNESKLTTREVVLMIAPALSKARVEFESRTPSLIRRWFGRRYEFVQNQSYSGWEDYERYVALPALSEILQLREATQATVLPDVSFRCFRRIALQEGRYQLAFLVAHHVTLETAANRSSVRSWEGIEFADGAWPWHDVDTVLRSITGSPPLSIVFIVCEAKKWGDELHREYALIGATAAAPWRMPLVPSLRFTRMWIQGLNGMQTTSEAYALAEREFMTDMDRRP